MPRDAISISTARQLIASGKATKEQIVAKFDVVDDEPVTPAPTGKVRTPGLDAMGVSGEEIKRRAAAGEENVQTGLRRGSVVEQAAAYGAEALTGAAEGLGGLVGLTTDVVTAPVRAARAGFSADGSVVDKMKAAAGGVLELPATRTATAAADDLRTQTRKMMGIDGVQVGPSGDLVRAVADVATPGPEVVGAARQIKRGAKVAGAADNVARQVDGAVPPDLAGVRSGAEINLPENVVEMPRPEAKVSGMDVRQTADGTVPPGAADADKYARPSAINLERLDIDGDAKQFIRDTAAANDVPVVDAQGRFVENRDIAAELEAVKGTPLTHTEIQEATGRAKILTDPTTRDTTLDLAADMLKSREALAEMAKTGKVTKEFVDLMTAVSSKATSFGRLLNSMNIKAGEEATMRDLVKNLQDMGKTSDEIVDTLKNVDLSDPKQATKAFNDLIKPKWYEVLDAYRYANLLSSPKTHIVNATSNALQFGVVRPLDRIFTGTIDAIASRVGGRERRHFASIPAYARGAVDALPKAWKAFADAMSGATPITHLDMQRSAASNKLPPVFKHVSRLLEGSDKFFMAIGEGAEFEALADAARKSGKAINEVELSKQATATAKEVVFRKPLDPANESGQGSFLSTIDKFTAGVQHVLDTKVGNVRPLRWAVPFVQTPMNIFKQGLEHSPLGLATMGKNTADNVQQLGKVMTGSMVMMGAGMLAAQGRTTWALPTNQKDREAFLAAGMQPYSIKIGDTWVGYQRLGPLATPIALAAAARHYAAEDPESTGDMDAQALASAVAGLAKMFGQQSYMEQLRNLIDAAQLEGGNAAALLANFPKQMVPLVSLQRWITQIVDPVYRKAPRRLGRTPLRNILKQIQKDIPGLSEGVDPYLDPNGEPSKRQLVGPNAVSPVDLKRENPEMMDYWLERKDLAKERAAARRAEGEQ